MSAVIKNFAFSAAPSYVLHEFNRIKAGEVANPFEDPTSREYRVVSNLHAALSSSTMKWADIFDIETLHNLVKHEYEEHRLNLLAEAQSNKFAGEAINTFVYQRADRSYKQVERLGITKKGPCCRPLDMSSEDRQCWSFEYEDPAVKAELKKKEAELVEMQGRVEEMEKQRIHITDRPQYNKTLDTLIKRMDVWIEQTAELEEKLVKKPHTCPWIHPGEVGWKNEWYAEYVWHTPEERKRKWAKFWADGKKEAKSAPMKESAPQKNSRFTPQQNSRPTPQNQQNGRFSSQNQQNQQKTDDVPIRRSLMASHVDDGWEAVPVKQKGGKSGKNDKGRW